jgi:Xaa-Pro aminopeptidase
MTLPDLPPMDVSSRVKRLRGRLDEVECDAVLLTRLVNIRYLTGFTGSAALLLVTPDELLFVTDGRYRDQSATQLAEAGVEARIEVDNARQREVVSEAAAGLARIGLEAGDVTWARQRSFDAEWFPDAELVATESLVEQLRLVKDAGEVARIEAAAVIADDALESVRPTLADEPTEEDFALELDTQIRRRGAEGTSFETITASGPHGAMPHARPSDRRMVEGDLVVLDFGAVVDGYCSDMTRTIILGDPSETQQRMLDVVTESQQAGVGAVRAGIEAKAVDAACREVIAEAGWADAFLHSTGHGVGLEIHEDPRVSSLSKAVLEEGFVVTVEPGVYLPEHGGVRVEDTVVVTTEGCRLLTHTPKKVTVS